MKLKLLLLTFVTTICYSADSTCPLMKGEENDPEETVSVQGKTLEFCCGSCVKQFDANKAYYIRVIPQLNKQFTEDVKKKLGVDKIVPLKQTFCAIYSDRYINPNSTSAEYKGLTVRFWSSSALRRWKRDPEKYYQEAVARGHLVPVK